MICMSYILYHHNLLPLQIQNASEDIIDSLTASETLLLCEAGFSNEMLSTANKHRACQYIMTHIVFKTRRDEINQLKEGLESVSLLSFLEHAESCLPLVFPLTTDVQVSTDSFLDLISKDWLSGLEGVQKRTMDWFSKYVRDVHDGTKGNYIHLCHWNGPL